MHPVIAKLGVARRRELSANPYFAALSRVSQGPAA